MSGHAAPGARDAVPLAGAGAPLVRRTTTGQVEGVDDSARSGTWYWKGIPFARAPEGALRWKAPRPPEPWQGIRPATQFGAACIQNPRLYSPGSEGGFDASVGANLASGHTPGSEDCLSLNIWRPAGAATGLPVIVFIHGGSNITGYSGDPLYDGAALARHAGAVVVSANYRLGQLGFFRHPALRDPAVDPTLTADDCSGNYAVLDILAALAFVQANIAEFGGDKDNVTLSGQSAGAINILAVATAPRRRSAGLFHRLAPLSGGISLGTSPGFPQPANDLQGNHGYIPALSPPASYELLSHLLLTKLLIDDGSAADAAAAAAWVAAHSNAEIAAYLRAKTASTILQVGRKPVGGIGDVTASGPIPEGTVVAADPIAAILAGDWPEVPVLAGMTASECKLLSTYLPLVGQAPGVRLGDAALFAILSDPARAQAARFGDVIDPAYPDGAAYDAAIAELDRKFFTALRDNLLDALAARQPDRVWSYRFDWRREAAPWDAIYGAAHLFDLPFLLGNFGPSLYANVIVNEANRSGRLALSEAMMTSLGRFAQAGNPGHAGLSMAWPNWPRVLVFDADDQQPRLHVE